MTYQGEIFVVGLELALNVRNKWHRTLFIKFCHLAAGIGSSYGCFCSPDHIYSETCTTSNTLGFGPIKDLPANSHALQVSLWENY